MVRFHGNNGFRMLLVLGFLLTAGIGSVKGGGREALAPSQAARIGMVDAWQHNLSISGGLAGLVNAKLFVDSEATSQFVEVVSDGKVLLRISAQESNAYGVPIGLEEAKRLAKLETYRFQRLDMETEVTVREVPLVRLYALGKDGTIECLDAETGRLLWAGRYGDPRIASLPLAVSQKYVTFVNANDLYVLDAATGAIIFEKHLDAVPLYGPAIVGEYIMCVCTGGRVEGYSTLDFQREPYVGHAAGLPMTGPVTSNGLGRMMWPTDAGYLYALDGNGRAEMAFRARTTGLVSAPLAGGPGGRCFAATERGHVYAIETKGNGRIAWRQSLGGPIYGSPVLVGNNLFVSTVYGQLHAMNGVDGSFLWPRSIGRVAQILGGTERQVLVRTISANLAAIDIQSGSVLAQLPGTSIQDSVPNQWTDRVYLLTQSGTVQCLRPVASDLPKMMAPQFAEPDSQSQGPPAEQQPEEEDDPPFQFNQGADPFGGDAGKDPFGGGADPFGGGGNGGDPFGGGADPFGGDGADPFGGG